MNGPAAAPAARPASPSGPPSSGPPREGWRSARPEVIIAAIGVAVVSAAGFAFAGLAGLVLILVIAAVAALAALRVLVPLGEAEPQQYDPPPTGPRGSFIGFFRRSTEVSLGTTSLASYDTGLRVTLQHLLAARLSERHGISLYQDPESARRLLLAGRRDDALWFWVDPNRPPVLDQSPRSGIPPRALAALIDRLERL